MWGRKSTANIPEASGIEIGQNHCMRRRAARNFQAGIIASFERQPGRGC
jgi:hypothetical protein